MTGLSLGTIAEEAAACRAAFAAHPEATYAWHLHHDQLAERLEEPPEMRIAYVLSDKSEAEQALRLRLFRPVLDDEAVAAAWRAYNEAEAAAWRAYNEAEAAARRAYNEAGAAARRVYSQAGAAARRAYDEAVAPAKRAHDEAVTEARRAFDEAVAEAHAAECPGCPWDGQSIFPPEEAAP